MPEFFGDDGNDTIHGTHFDDLIRGRGGDDNLYAGAGNDFVDGDSGDDKLYGDEGDDALLGANGNDDMVGGSGNDNLRGGNGADYLSGDGFSAGTSGDDSLYGGAGDDSLDGGGGNDILDGEEGADQMQGGDGDDLYIVDNGFDHVIELDNDGTDTVQSSVDFNLGVGLEHLTLTGTGNINGDGNQLDNIIIGNAGENRLTSYSGASSGVDVLLGGAGNDHYLVGDGTTIVELAGNGTDYVESFASLVLSANVEHLTLLGTASIDGTGNPLANTIIGNSGNNLLIGGAGIDRLEGGAGNDTYDIDNVADVVVEESNAGVDLVRSRVAYTLLGLATNVEALTLLGSNTISGVGNLLDNTITGNDGHNRLEGGAGNDTLVGGSGNDTLLGESGNDSLGGGSGADAMAGGTGNDLYYVNDSGDLLTETSNAGTDLVLSSVSYTLRDHVDNLTLTGAIALVGIGNAQINSLVGNDLDNTLEGRDGSDSLDGKLGADTMRGGSGNDTYYVDNANDEVIETLNAGTERVLSSASFTLGPHVENLTLTGVANRNGFGNELNNLLTGNSGKNVLDGNLGNDTLDGMAGADTMFGGGGDDHYVVDNIGDTVTELGPGIDSVSSRVTFTLGADVDHLTLVGAGLINGTGNALNNTLVGNGAKNTLDGKLGNDLLDGKGGADNLFGGGGDDDIYVVDNSGDVVLDFGAGIDTVRSSVNYTLGTNLEHLTLTGSSLRNGFGNELNNNLIGNSAKNTLGGNRGNDFIDGRGGADTMSGDAGNDTYMVDNVGDVISDSGPGVELVQSTISYTLGANLEHLTLLGFSPRNGTGNELNNNLTGNAAKNILDGKFGNDRLEGKVGADVLIGGEGNDTFIYTALNHGGDTIADFSQSGAKGNDRIDVSVLLSGDGVKEDFAFGGTTATAHGIWFNETSSSVRSTTTVYFDTNGDTRNVEMVLNLAGVGLGLSASDFIL